MEQVNRNRFNKVKKLKNIVMAVKCLTKGIMICSYINKPVKPIHCASLKNCRDKFCPSRKYVLEICERYEVDEDDVWNRQTIYPKDE